MARAGPRGGGGARVAPTLAARPWQPPPRQGLFNNRRVFMAGARRRGREPRQQAGRRTRRCPGPRVPPPRLGERCPARREGEDGGSRLALSPEAPAFPPHHQGSVSPSGERGEPRYGGHPEEADRERTFTTVAGTAGVLGEELQRESERGIPPMPPRGARPASVPPAALCWGTWGWRLGGRFAQLRRFWYLIGPSASPRDRGTDGHASAGVFLQS